MDTLFQCIAESSANPCAKFVSATQCPIPAQTQLERPHPRGGASSEGRGYQALDPTDGVDELRCGPTQRSQNIAPELREIRDFPQKQQLFDLTERRQQNILSWNMITIGFLADYPDTIPILAKWFRDQWPGYYANWSQTEMEQDFLEDTFRNRLPCRLVAFESNELVGTIILREQGIGTLPGLQPELGGLYVIESHRGHGIATELVRAGMKLALDQGYETVYATTVVAAGILERLGWQFIRTVIHQDGPLSLYRYKR